MKSSPRSHIPFLLIAISITVLVLALYAYMYYQVGSSTKKAMEARELAITERYNKSKEAELIKLYETTARDRQRLAGLFIPADANVQFIEAVESIGPASGSDLKLTSIDADSLVGAGPGESGEIRATIEATGTWSAIMRALLLSERMPYKITVDNIRLDHVSGGSSKTSTKGWKMNFEMRANIISTAVSTTTTP